MKRLAWLWLVLLCTALVQAQALPEPDPAPSCPCCHPDACNRPVCCPPASAALPIASSVPTTVSPDAGRKTRALQRAERFPTAGATSLRLAPLVSAGAAPAVRVPLFEAHCSLLI